ncbi:MAG: ABC transporter ATP-binding protein [Candidatus Bipolaricaulota bacterium]|jgi:ABC-2 type transport system ATP-binding protein|nr:ABC transporter ATP-binding protein [Candidatus Bipolaricaulota bacterium]
MQDASSILMRVTGLEKHYGAVRAVDGISFSVPRASVFTILGPNGAGKTTTLEILEGIREPDRGEIEVFGAKLRRVTRAVKERMGVLLQDANFEPYLRVKEVIALFASFFRRAVSVDEILTRVALQDKAKAMVRTLSGGQRQRLAVAVALINDPELVFLDEPTTGLDPQARRNMWSIVAGLKERGKTIILTTHYMEEAEALSDHICIMDLGKIIAEGSPRQLAAGLGRETIVEFVADHLDPGDVDNLKTFGQGARTDGEVVTLQTNDLVGTMEGLLAWSRERGIPLANMAVRQPNLEDVFLALTGRRLRE